MSDPRVSKASVEISANTAKLDIALSGIQQKLKQLNQLTGTSFGLLGVGYSINSLVQLGAEAITAGNALTTVQATLRAVAGSQEAYDRILQEATKNQMLFGGSLEQSLGTMQQFAFIANRTGADLGQLNDVAQLLAVVNPFEGFEGAGFALSELFAGDITSIVERFNLPRQAIRDLLNESSSAEEIIAGLTSLLAEQGITAETLAARTDTVAQTYQTLGTLASNTFVQIGQSAAAAFEPVALLLSKMMGLNEILATETNVAAATTARTYEQYSAAIDEAAAATDDAGKRIELQNMKLNEAQFTYMQALVMTGVTMESAIDQAQLYGRTWVELTEGAGYYEEQSGALAEAQALLAEATRNAAIQNREQAAAQADAIGIIDTSTLATKALDDALGEATKAMFAAANANLSLDEQAQQAAIALLEAGEAGRLAALKLGDSTSNIDKLIARYYNLAVAAQSARNASVVAGMELGLVGPSAPVVVPRTTITPPTGGGGGGGGTSAARDQADEVQRIAERHQENMLRAEETYQARLLRITEDYAKRRREANQDYSDQQFQDRADFYRSLMGIEDDAIKQQASAEYEALALQATQIRDTLGADVAAAFLEEAGRIAAARAKRADEIRKAQEDNSGNLAYLTELDKMEREVEDRRLQRAATGEGSLVNDEEQAKQDAALQLQQDIKQATDDAGKALIDAQADANRAIGTTNDALQKQVDLLNQIGGRPVTTGTTTATTTAPTTTASTIAGAAGGAGVAVYDAVVAQALAGVRDAVNAVERAVSRIPTRSAVGGG